MADVCTIIIFMSLVGEDRSAQITILFMIEVIISDGGRVPKGRKNLTKHDKT
jgi:hypothetical protein